MIQKGHALANAGPGSELSQGRLRFNQCALLFSEKKHYHQVHLKSTFSVILEVYLDGKMVAKA